MLRPTDPGSRCPHLMDPGSGHQISSPVIRSGVRSSMGPRCGPQNDHFGSHISGAECHHARRIHHSATRRVKGPYRPHHTHAGRGTGGCEDAERHPSIVPQMGPREGSHSKMGYPRSIGSRGDHIRGPRIPDPEDPPTAKPSSEWREAPHSQAPTGPWCRCMHNVQCNLGHHHCRMAWWCTCEDGHGHGSRIHGDQA